MNLRTTPTHTVKTCGLQLGATLAASLLLLAAARNTRAELLIGLTTQNNLISFDSATPGTINTIGTISGLTAGDTLVGIDRRPQHLAGSSLPGPNNGRIFAVGVNFTGGSARIYTLSEFDAAAMLLSTLAPDPADVVAPFPFTTVSGTSFGVDFNPVPDRLRVTSNTGQNLRINVDNGLVQLDVPLAYQAGDPNFGDAPFEVAVAYSNNFGGATSTTLRGVDIGQLSDALVIHTNPNGGLLQTSLDLSFNSTSTAAYDISGITGTPYFAIQSPESFVSSLYSSGPGGVTLTGTIGGGVPLIGLAAPVGAPIPEPGGLGLLALALTLLTGRKVGSSYADLGES
ncbi:MAG: DUF4394 domain-containing protein [Verrucomicrobiales bacterium]